MDDVVKSARAAWDLKGPSLVAANFVPALCDEIDRLRTSAGVPDDIAYPQCPCCGHIWHERAIDAALARQSQPPASEWRPIETAPNEGKIIVWGGHHTAPEIRPADGDWWRHHSGMASLPTHWQPLPTPPKEAGNAE